LQISDIRSILEGIVLIGNPAAIGQARMGRMRRSVYWVFTILLVVWLVAGGSFDLARAFGAMAILRTLGYPPYLCTILGVAKLLAVPALLYSRAGRIQEWAYAGVAFDGLGALLSHAAVHDTAGATIAPLLFLTFMTMSYLLRPVSAHVATLSRAEARPES
jgi:hypothetical protein